MRKTLALLTAALLLTTMLTVPAAAAALPFRDVAATDWFCEPVQYVYDNGLFSGVAADRFAPYANMSRAMFVTVLWRQAAKLGRDVSAPAAPFADLRMNWYRAAVDWAYSNEIVRGSDAQRFAPDEALTREQMCAILIRFLRTYLGYDLSAYAGAADFSDHADISAYALESVTLAQRTGLVGGYTLNGRIVFNPRGKAARAEVAKVIMLESRLIATLSASDGTGGTGGGTGTHTAAEIAREAEIAGYLKSMLANYQTLRPAFPLDAAAETCMETFIGALRDALAAHDGGEFLDSAYVAAHYGAQMTGFKTQYQALDAAEVAQIRDLVVRLGDTAALYAVLDYFGVSLASLG